MTRPVPVLYRLPIDRVPSTISGVRNDDPSPGTERGPSRDRGYLQPGDPVEAVDRGYTAAAGRGPDDMVRGTPSGGTSHLCGGGEGRHGRLVQLMRLPAGPGGAPLYS